MMNDNIGIDISKAHLDVWRPLNAQTARFDNSAAGLTALMRFIGVKQPDRVIYEATGACHRLLEKRCAGHLPLVKVNPLAARRFAQACGTRAKTDAVDARMLALMGEALDLQPDIPVSEDHHDLKQLQVARSGIIKARTRLKNRLKTQTLPLLKRQAKAQLALLDRQLKAIDTEIADTLSRDQARALDILQSISGFGPVVAATILIECPQIGTMDRKQAASLAGLAPMTRQSGQWWGRAFIQGRRKYLRDALYMPALVAIRFNPDMKTKYEALRAAGKPPKVAMTAIMRKLIELANILIKQNRKWTQKST